MKDPSSGPEFGKAGAQGAIWGRATRQAGWLQSGGWGGGAVTRGTDRMPRGKQAGSSLRLGSREQS